MSKSSIDIKTIATDFLKSHNISPSIQRLEILSFLLVSTIHPSADEIYAHLKDQIPTLSKTTVYNTLKLFIKENLIQTLNIDDKEERFDVAVRKHAHYLCSKCGKIEDIDNKEIIDILSKNTIDNNQVDFSVINFVGVCSDCLTKNN